MRGAIEKNAFVFTKINNYLLRQNICITHLKLDLSISPIDVATSFDCIIIIHNMIDLDIES